MHVWRRCNAATRDGRSFRHPPVAIAVFFIAVSASPAVSQSESPADDTSEQDQIVALAVEYAANRDSFNSILECRYDLRLYVNGDSAGIFAGRAPAEQVARGLMVRDGDLSYTEIDADEVPENGTHAWIWQAVLQDGERGIYYSRGLNGAVLYSPAYPPRRRLMTPFSWGLISYPNAERDFSTVIENTNLDLKTHLIDSPVPDDPWAAVSVDSLIGVELAVSSNSDKHTYQYFVALEHGCLPIVSRKFINGVLRDKCVITDVRDVDGNRFFPMRTIWTKHHPDDPERIGNAIETRVTELKVDVKPNPALFRVQIDDDALVRDGADDRSQFHFGPGEDVTLNDLDGLFARAAEQSAKEAIWDKQNAAELTPNHPVKERSPLILINVVVLVVLGAAFLIVWLLRMRRGHVTSR